VSLATWRRMESATDVASFRRASVDAAERALRLPPGGLIRLIGGNDVPDVDSSRHRDNEWIRAICASFTGNPVSARQSYKIAMAVAGMDDDDDFVGWSDYLAGRSTVDDLALVNELPDWVLFIANNVWLQRFRGALVAIGEKVERGSPLEPTCMAERVALHI